MMTRRYFFSALCMILAVGVLLLAPQPGVTQDTDSTCPTLVKQALADLGENCGGLERNAKDADSDAEVIRLLKRIEENTSLIAGEISRQHKTNDYRNHAHAPALPSRQEVHEPRDPKLDAAQIK